MNIVIKKTLHPADKLKPLVNDAGYLPFGRNFTDHMFTMEYDVENGWHDPEIKPYQPLVLDPAAAIFHYGQEVFEGQKAYKNKDGRILLFRPLENAKRFNRSLDRMCMPKIPEEIYLAAESELLRIEKRWIPATKDAAIYIRPFVIATEPFLGVRPAERYLFCIILSLSGTFFKGQLSPVGLLVSDFYVRAVEGGTGAAKTGGNYGGSLIVAKMAKDKGYEQVLWLDAKEHKYVEEAGAMNIFFVIENKLVTPKCSGNILEGVTRKSILRLAQDLGIEVEERAVSICEIMNGIEQQKVTEIFSTGTAVVITPVNRLHYKGKEYNLKNEGVGQWTQSLYKKLTDIQYGETEDTYGWVCEV